MDQKISNKDFQSREPQSQSKTESSQYDKEKSSASPYSYKDFTKTPEKTRPSVQKRIKKVAVTLAICLLMGIIGYKYAGKLLPQTNLAFSKTAHATQEITPPKKPTFPNVEPETTRESEIAQAVEFLDLQRQNQRQVQLIRNLKDQLSESYERLNTMKSSLNKHKRVIATQKKEQNIEDSLKEQIILAQTQLTEKEALAEQLQERLQKLEKHSEESQKNLNKHQQGNTLLTQRFNQVQKHLQKAQEELLEQSTENERLVTAVNALQAELATTALRLKEKEQMGAELVNKTKMLHEQLTAATTQIAHKDKELSHQNSLLHTLYEEQNRLQEVLTERDGMTNKLLAKVKKLKGTLEEREREAYLQALEQLSSTKRAFKNTTAVRFETSGSEIDLDQFLENREKDSVVKNKPLESSEKPQDVKNYLQLTGDGFIDESGLEEAPQSKTKNLSSNRKKQNPDNRKKAHDLLIAENSDSKRANTNLLEATSYPYESDNQPDEKLIKKKSALVARDKKNSLNPAPNRILETQEGVKDGESFDSLNRELDLEREKIQELEKSLQATLSSYESTQKQMKSMRAKGNESGLSFE